MVLFVESPLRDALNHVLNENPLAQAVGQIGSAFLGVNGKPLIDRGRSPQHRLEIQILITVLFSDVRPAGALFQVCVDGLHMIAHSVPVATGWDAIFVHVRYSCTC